MPDPFKAVLPTLDWLDRAYAAVADDEEAMFSEAGWEKFWAKASLMEAAEASARRELDDYETCVRGEKCPEVSPYRCQGCESHRERLKAVIG